MTFTIGRASFDNNPTAIRQYGDRLSLDINILPSTLVEAKVLRQQVLGLANNADEPVVPLTWDADSDYDGFYRVIGVDVEPVQSYLSNNLMRCRIDLERVGGGYARPTMDMAYVRGSRPTSNEAVTASYYLGIPADADERGIGTFTREAVGGDVEMFDVSADDDVPFGILPASHYDGACEIEVLIGGTWHTVIGTQVPSSASSVRIHNGLVRIEWMSDGDLALDVFDGTTWDAVHDFVVSDTTSGPGINYWLPGEHFTVLRNGPETCVIDIPGALSGGLAFGARLQFAVTRGAHAISVTGKKLNTGTQWRVDSKTATAGTSVTGGIQQTSNGATGHRYIMMSPENNTKTAASSTLAISGTSLTYSFGLGVELTGSSATGQDTAANVIAQWWGVVAQTQVVVAR